ncbi:hypothetical protein JWG40_10520 [Leptospira sp. 201903074]|uniref:ABC-three component system middle component 8 n=1 Tax=Leptospira abararensis TaxID=2810036 RepID=UPI0019640BA3|nr:ABC-three component system middle component 8 [Leptospira abararensis]MBM9547451.1 hypothetical protein [Leptospira abararensis]
MIKIERYFNFKENPITLAGEIGLSLKFNSQINMNELILDFSKRYPTSFESLFNEAIILLYSLGKIEYDAQSDTLKYIS